MRRRFRFSLVTILVAIGIVGVAINAAQALRDPVVAIVIVLGGWSCLVVILWRGRRPRQRKATQSDSIANETP